ncbi:MAG: phosphoribosylglycinamide formyltransferase [Muribaculaceae bacterium]|nr:phosphoribosylglycinamide formyltransferase [Muribaculaceae bacterium]
MNKLAIFVSGSGTNAENIIRYFQTNKELDTEVAIVISNRADAYALERAKKLNVPSTVLSRADFNNPDITLPLLDSYGINFIVLAGFLLKVPEYIVDRYKGHIVNIHPALLPKFGGKGMYGHHVHEALVAAGEKETGITIHHVNENYDQGSIIFQATVAVAPNDPPDDVAAKIHELEQLHFPRVIAETLRSL